MDSGTPYRAGHKPPITFSAKFFALKDSLRFAHSPRKPSSYINLSGTKVRKGLACARLCLSPPWGRGGACKPEGFTRGLQGRLASPCCFVACLSAPVARVKTHHYGCCNICPRMGAIPLRGRLRVFEVRLTPPKRGHEPYLKNPQALWRVAPMRGQMCEPSQWCVLTLALDSLTRDSF